MNEELKLRPAVVNDCDLLFKWIKDPDTQKSHKNKMKVNIDAYSSWFKKTLKNENKKIIMVEDGINAVGSISCEYFRGTYELSWMIAPDAVGSGVGRRMVELFIKNIILPVKVKITSGDYDSIHIAEYSGMMFDREHEGLIHFQRGPAVKV